MSDVIKLASQLIKIESVTPKDMGAQALIAERLSPLGFDCTALPKGEVDNLWAQRGDASPIVVFAGHTDVVPTGDPSAWRFPPFEPTLDDGKLYGRGAADMKGSLAAMIIATERFLAEHPTHRGAIGFLITSGEEGAHDADGTPTVMSYLNDNNQTLDYCIVGEPSSTKTIADVVKVGRRGSLNAKLTITGLQGHVAYPHLADNPIHHAMKALAELVEIEWDNGNDFFPATCLQISNIHAGTGVGNVIPGDICIDFNLRFSPEITPEAIQSRTEALLQQHCPNFHCDWHVSGSPFMTQQGDLLSATIDSIEAVTGKAPELSTSGGTSDGRYIAPFGVDVLELGPCNATIHQVDEHVSVQELESLVTIYQKILEKLL